MEFTPKFDAPETTERFSAALQQAAEVEARRLLYVAILRSLLTRNATPADPTVMGSQLPNVHVKVTID